MNLSEISFTLLKGVLKKILISFQPAKKDRYQPIYGCYLSFLIFEQFTITNTNYLFLLFTFSFLCFLSFTSICTNTGSWSLALPAISVKSALI